VLKGSLSKASGNIALRRTLVVIQFSISMIMIICTWIVYGQLQYVRNKDLGFDKERVLTVAANTNRNISGDILAFKNKMKSNRIFYLQVLQKLRPEKGSTLTCSL
jgi:putative ABC transport system permease protein